MPRAALELTWIKTSRRWRKRYKRREFFFPFGTSKTDKEGYKQALAAWEAKKAEIDGQPKPNQEQYEKAISRNEQMRDWFRRNGDQDGVAAVAATIDQLKADLRKPEPPELDQFDLHPTNRGSEVGRAVWADRLARDEKESGKKDSTVGAAIESFLDRQESQVIGKQRTAGRYGNLSASLKHFKGWFGINNDVREITARTLEDYQSSLVRLVGSEEIASNTARDRMMNLKFFIRWAWELDLLDLPRNIKSQALTIRVESKKIKFFSKEEIATLLAGSTGQTKSYILLCLNCGMTQKDIADLRQEQVDWTAGRIIRKRSKTEHHKDVPEVNYKLWPETFRLLKKFRSKSERVLLNHNGGPLYSETIVGRMTKKNDNVKSAYSRLVKSLKIKDPKSLKLFRKTGASTLKTHEIYGQFDTLYLGHSPRSIADKHYSAYSQELFDRAVEWLGSYFGLNK
jgi:integrase